MQDFGFKKHYCIKILKINLFNFLSTQIAISVHKAALLLLFTLRYKIIFYKLNSIKNFAIFKNIIIN
jgi:hypothetical protein